MNQSRNYFIAYILEQVTLYFEKMFALYPRRKSYQRIAYITLLFGPYVSSSLRKLFNLKEKTKKTIRTSQTASSGTFSEHDKKTSLKISVP